MNPEIQALEARLAQLESQNAHSAFMGKYGGKFGGDVGIGTAILGELNRRGIDTTAADEAVQEILDQLRAEASAVLDKLNNVEGAVNAALQGGSGGINPEAEPGGAPPPDMGAGAPPPDMGAGAPPPDMGAGAPPPPDMGAGAPPPDMGMLSDKNKKTDITPTNRLAGIRASVLSDERFKDLESQDDNVLTIFRELADDGEISDDDFATFIDAVKASKEGKEQDVGSDGQEAGSEEAPEEDVGFSAEADGISDNDDWSDEADIIMKTLQKYRR